MSFSKTSAPETASSSSLSANSAPSSERNMSFSYAMSSTGAEPSIPFEFVPNPGANYGLINAVNSAHTLDACTAVYIGTLGIEMDWIPTAARNRIDQEALHQHACLPVWL